MKAQAQRSQTPGLLRLRGEARARGLAGALALVFATGLAITASAQQSPEEWFSHGVAALEEGSYEKAISLFEALADRGFAHPDAAYNRGLAYLARVRAQAEKPGDLGRAAAGFEECLNQRSTDIEAERALDSVRAEVARRRALRGEQVQVQARPPLDHAIVGLFPETVWALAALVSSLTLAVGLILRRRSNPAVRLAGVIATPLGAIGLLVFGLITMTARHLRHTTSPAVVVSAEARLLDERGVIRNAEPVPEAARVDVLERRGALARIRHGTTEGWMNSASLRLLQH